MESSHICSHAIKFLVFSLLKCTKAGLSTAGCWISPKEISSFILALPYLIFVLLFFFLPHQSPFRLKDHPTQQFVNWPHLFYSKPRHPFLDILKASWLKIMCSFFPFQLLSWEYLQLVFLGSPVLLVGERSREAPMCAVPSSTLGGNQENGAGQAWPLLRHSRWEVGPWQTPPSPSPTRSRGSPGTATHLLGGQSRCLLCNYCPPSLPPP